MSALVQLFPSDTAFRRRPAPVWLLLSNRPGDNNQLFALADALRLPFESKKLRFNQLRKFPALHGSGLAIVSRKSRGMIEPPWPDLVISAGYPAIPVARYILRESGGRTKVVHIGNARTAIEDFDLHLTTPQYPAWGNEHSIEIPFPIGNPAKTVKPTGDELGWLAKYPRPLRLIAVGGPARHWELDHAALRTAIHALRDKAPHQTIIAATSPRTRTSTRRLLDRLLTRGQEAVVDSFPRFATLLSQADEIYVTADSVSMISEAVLTGKPVGIIPIRRSGRGQIARWLLEPLGRTTLPNFPNFWELLRRRRLLGTVELPVSSQVCDTIERAAIAVRSLLAPEDGVDEGKAQASVTHLGAARRSRG